MDSFSEKGFGFILLFFALPTIFIPPGINSFAVIPVLVLSIQFLIGKNTPWLPQWLLKKKIKRTILEKTLRKIEPKLIKLEEIIKPRFPLLCRGKISHLFVGAMATIFSLSIVVPLPATNLLPAIGISIMSIGIIQEDGLAVIIGSIIGILGTLITLAIIIGSILALS